MAWQALRPEARRAGAWRVRVGLGFLFVVAGTWAAAAPQGALGLGERLRLGFEAVAVLCGLLAATAGLRHRTEAIEDELLGVSRGQRALAKFAANWTKASRDLMPAIPFVVFALAVPAISFLEMIRSAVAVGILMLVSLLLPGFRSSLLVMVAGAVMYVAWGRNMFEQVIVALFGVHFVMKALIAWSAVERAHGLRDNLKQEAVTPLTAEEFSDRNRGAIWRRFAIPVWLLAGLNLMIVRCLGYGGWPLKMEGKLAVGLMLVAGAVLLLIDAAALTWRGLLDGAQTSDPCRAFAMLFGGIIGAPWAVAWAFYALHAGEVMTLTEGAAYWFLWTALGAVLSWVVGARARDRFRSELREILSEPE